MNLDNIFGKRKKGKDPFANIFPKSKPMGSLFPKMKSQPLIPKFKKQRSIIPSMNMPQKVFLKRTTGMKQRFTDHDKDGVISGLDCFPFDKKRHMAWSKGTKTNLPEFEGDWGPDYDNEEVYEKRRVKMDPKVFLKRQYEQSGYASEISQEEWERGAFPNRVESIKKAIKSKSESVPVPVEQYDQYGQRKDFQEGRHRGLAAKELNEKVPVIQARKKFNPWDRENNDPYNHRKSHWYEKPDDVDNRWEREKDDFEEDDE